MAEPRDGEGSGPLPFDGMRLERAHGHAPVVVAVRGGVAESCRVSRLRQLWIPELVPAGGEPRVGTAVMDDERARPQGEDGRPDGDSERTLVPSEGPRPDMFERRQ